MKVQVQMVLSVLAIGGIVGASSVPARACGGCAASAGGAGRVAYGKAPGRAPVLAQAKPATNRAPAGVPTGAIAAKKATTPALGASKTDANVVAKAPAASLVYTCPMHPQVQGATPTACPICGMKLKPKPTKADATKRASAPSDKHVGNDTGELGSMSGMQHSDGMGDMQMCPGCKMTMDGASGMTGTEAPVARQKASGNTMRMVGMGCGC
ncbi:MAG TPA: heavy metal-binding domain-containing protein [Pirellulales bacterium]|nr:heavy metal-binding domain-containing protein [Pirellulales bacterium]